MNRVPIVRNCRTSAVITLVASVAAATYVSPTSAALIYGVDNKGHVVAGSAEFTAAGDTLTLTLTNTTPLTNKVTDLLTGIDFSLIGLTPTLTSVTGLVREVDDDGGFSDGSVAENLNWSLQSSGADAWRLGTSNASYAIIGPPNQGNYAEANPSVRGNPGHNPYAAETIVATFNVPGLSSVSTPIVAVAGFGFSGGGAANATITPSGGLEVPEPATIALISIAAVTLIWRWPRR